MRQLLQEKKQKESAMGYEILMRFHPELEKGKYNEDKVETKTVKVGSPYDDVPLEIAAGKIIAQLARRNILVVDVEIYEFTRKKLSYKETEDGILIKHKKFSFDDGANLQVQDIPEEQPQDPQAALLALLQANPQLGNILQVNQKASVAKQPTPFLPGVGRPLREEVYDPEPWLLEEAKKRGISFTPKKKYPIFQESIAPNFAAGMLYTTVDDNGNKQVISDKHFIIAPNLDAEFLSNGQQNAGPQLRWEGDVTNEPVHIR